MIGKWKIKVDTTVSMGLSVFTLPKGTIVDVTQVDKSCRKYMVRVDDRCCDWMSDTWIVDRCTPIN